MKALCTLIYTFYPHRTGSLAMQTFTTTSHPARRADFAPWLLQHLADWAQAV